MIINMPSKSALPRLYFGFFISWIFGLILFFNLLTCKTRQVIAQENQMQESGIQIEVKPPVIEIATVDSIYFDISPSTFGSKIKISGKAPPKSTVKIFIQGKAITYYLTRETVADENGNWEIEIHERLSHGTYVTWVVAITHYQKELESAKTEFAVPDFTAHIQFAPQTVISPSPVQRISLTQPLLLFVLSIAILTFIITILIIIAKNLLSFVRQKTPVLSRDVRERPKESYISKS